MEITLDSSNDQLCAVKERRGSDGLHFWRLWEPTELIQAGDTRLHFTTKPGDIGSLSLCRRVTLIYKPDAVVVKP